ncbi:MAG: iron-containing alcohol dehydrogenase [Betaproteobacteria bacterium]|nr:iron-containing alcohol dehydrogenase [Betaproteobacteria bacterium]
MHCCQYYLVTGEGDPSFTIELPQVTFGAGCLAEAGAHAQALGLRRVGLFTDKRVAHLPHVETVETSLRAAGVDVARYDEVHVEPTDQSFQAAARFAAEGKFDGFVSVGGGSVMDTCKAANVYATYPADFLTYINAPIGGGQPIPGPLKPHIACPTTSGTGSECTGIAIFDLLAMKAKTGVMNRRMIPTVALVDPLVTRTLPRTIVASSGFDAMSHALESLTARPHSKRQRTGTGPARPMNQGANLWSDMGAREALRLIGRYLVRAVKDAADDEARANMMYAGMLAGMTFSNAGCHLPHGMSYAVSGLVRGFRAPDYPAGEPMVPHGMSVMLNAPSVYRFTAPACPERHLDGAECLGADMRGASAHDAGEVLAKHLIGMMQATDFPGGLTYIGYGENDLDALTEGAFPQRRVIGNAPRDVSKDELRGIFRGAMKYW